MEGSSHDDDGSSCMSLLCHEDQSCMNYDDDDDNVHAHHHISCDWEYEDDYIKMLVQKELIFEPNSPPCASSSFDYPIWLQESRFEAVKWILNTQALMRYGNQTAYLTVTYLDRFLSIRFIDQNKLWAVRLLSVACLSLSAKMEECKVASLSEYPVRDYEFDCQVIKKMELLILSAFKWKLSFVTPFAYLHFFIKTLSTQGINPDDLLSKAVELLVAFIQEIKLIDYRPSIIAATAVLAALDWNLTQETLGVKMSSLSIWEGSEKLQQEEQLFTCYSLMQRFSAKCKLSTSTSLTGLHHTLTDTPSVVVGTKRSLTFSDSDQDLNLRDKIHRE